MSRAAGFLALACACVLPLGCDPIPPMGPGQNLDGTLIDQTRRKDSAWTTEKWTGDNAPYHAVRLELEERLAKNLYATWMVEDAKNAFLHHPRDPMLLYRWAYAAYRTAFPGKYGRLWNAGVVRDRFSVVPSPHTAEYSRLRFLIDAREFAGVYAPGDRLIQMGRKLLALDPADDVVKTKLAALLVCGGTVERINEGIAMTEGFLARSNPDNYYRDLAGVGYLLRYLKARDKSDARKCVEYWKAYEAHATTAEERVSEERNIKQITKDAGL